MGGGGGGAGCPPAAPHLPTHPPTLPTSPPTHPPTHAQYMSTIEWLKTCLTQQGFGYRFISGSMPLKQRAKAISAFQVGGSAGVCVQEWVGGLRCAPSCPCCCAPPSTPPPHTHPPTHPHAQNDPPTTVFLLSIRSGAVGINLTAASHVL